METFVVNNYFLSFVIIIFLFYFNFTFAIALFCVILRCVDFVIFVFDVLLVVVFVFCVY